MKKEWENNKRGRKEMGEEGERGKQDQWER